MEFFSGIINHLKDSKLMFVLFILMIISGAIEQYFKVSLLVSIGGAGSFVYGIRLIYEWYKARQVNYDFSKYNETMSNAQKALDRSKQVSKDAKFCPECDERMKIRTTGVGGAWFICPKCGADIWFDI